MVADGTHWDDLPDILTTSHLCALLHVKDRETISKWQREGQLPKPCISSKRKLLWRKEDIRKHLENRMRYA